MIRRIKELVSSGFVKNVAIVATGAAGAQAVTMAFSPIISRIYSPEAFGVLGTFMALLNIFAPVGAFAYPVAIVLPKSDEDARGLAKLSVMLSLIFTAFLSCVVIFFGMDISRAFGLESVASYLLLVPVAMFFMSLVQVMQNILIRKRLFQASARAAVIQSIALNTAKVSVGIHSATGAVLVFVSTFANLGYVAILFWSAKAGKRAIKNVLTANFHGLAVRFLDYPKYRVPQLFVNSLSNSLPIILISSIFGPASAGIFSLAWSMVTAPAILIGQSVAKVFYPDIVSRMRRNEPTAGFLIRAMLLISIPAAMLSFVLFLFGEPLFKLAFGSQWIESGYLAGWLSLSVFFGMIHRPCEPFIQAAGLNKLYMCYEVVFTALIFFGLNLVGVISNSFHAVVICFVVIKSLYYGGIVVYVYIYSVRGVPPTEKS